MRWWRNVSNDKNCHCLCRITSKLLNWFWNLKANLWKHNLDYIFYSPTNINEAKKQSKNCLWNDLDTAPLHIIDPVSFTWSAIKTGDTSREPGRGGTGKEGHLYSSRTCYTSLLLSPMKDAMISNTARLYLYVDLCPVVFKII